jgi:type IV secretory pathway VirJ component
LRQRRVRQRRAGAELCRDAALAGVEIIRTRGGHHFDGDYRGLAERILRGGGVKSALSQSPPS